MSGDGPEAALAVSPLAGLPGLRWTQGVPTIASPMRQAVDAANWIVEADGVAPVFLKIYCPDVAIELDFAAAWAAARSAGILGVAPKGRFALPGHGALATTYLPAPWRPAFLDDLLRPGVLAAAIAAKRAFQAGPALDRVWDVFAETDTVLARARGIRRPSDVDGLADWSRSAGAAMSAAGIDRRPCHNDGSASGLMIGPDDAVRLVDFDCAGQSDPTYDLALLLNEVSAFGDPWSDGVALFAGTADPRMVDRARVYAAADDILWGLWGWLQSATSPRRSVEFLKYGEWRLLRARKALREADFADRLRRL